MRQRIIWAAMLVVVTFLWTLAILQWQDCGQRGGAYVRSLFWFTCVGARR
jgi:hypothetical protein